MTDNSLWDSSRHTSLGIGDRTGEIRYNAPSMGADYTVLHRACCIGLGVRRTTCSLERKVHMPRDIAYCIESGHNGPSTCQHNLRPVQLFAAIDS